MSIAIQVNPNEVRVYNKEGALRAFFNFDLGFTDEEGAFHGILTSRDWTLFERNDGTGFWVKAPEKVMTKNGQPVMGDDNRPKRLELITKFFGEPGQDGKARPTKASYQFFDLLTERVVAVYQQKAGRTPQAAAAGVATSVGEQEAGTPFDDDSFPWEK